MFKGFCNEHDNKTFALIDSDPPKNIEKKEMFLYLFRTLCFEIFRKKLLYEKNHFMIKNIRNETDFKLIQNHGIYKNWHKNVLIQNKGLKLFIKRDSTHIQDKLEKMYKQNNFNDMRYIIAYTNLLPVYLSTMLNPLFDSYNPKDLHFQPLMAVNIIPLANRSFICFCWVKEHDCFMEKFLDYFEYYKLEKIVNIISFLESEDVSINPLFFRNLNKDEREILVNAIATPHTVSKEQNWEEFPALIKISNEKIIRATN